MEKNNYKCSSIDHKETEAVIQCQYCKVYLCNKCETFHSKIFQNHPVKNLSIEGKDIFVDICKEKSHLNKLKFFCMTHNQLCCAACISKIKDEENGQHKDCKVSSLSEIKTEKEKIFKEKFDELEGISKTLKETINKLKIAYEEIYKNKEDLIVQIQKVFTELRNDLNKREDELILEVEEKFK